MFQIAQVTQPVAVYPDNFSPLTVAIWVKQEVVRATSIALIVQYIEERPIRPHLYTV